MVPEAGAWNCDPPHPAFDFFRASILDAYRRTGKDFTIGRRIARMLRDAGSRTFESAPPPESPDRATTTRPLS